MTMLRNLLEGDDVLPRVWTNNGSYREVIDRDGSFRNCFFPKNDWVELSPQENSELWNSNILAQCLLTVLSVPEELSNVFWKEIFPVTCLSSEEKAENRMDLLRQFSHHVNKVLSQKKILSFQKVRSCDIIINPPNLNTTAFDYGCDSYLGLHIDNQERLPYRERDKAFSFLCINFGCSPRYVQFLPFTIADIFLRLDIDIANEDAKGRFKNVRYLVDRFLSTFPNLPVMRVEILPCQAYTTVTQNIIHDGATNSEGDADVVAMIGGYF